MREDTARERDPFSWVRARTPSLDDPYIWFDPFDPQAALARCRALAGDGAGILDAKALLEAPLPYTTPPPLVLSEWTAESTSTAPSADGAPPPLSEAAAYLPELDPDAVERAMTEMSGGAWDELGDEILFHLATDPAFRDALRDRMGQAARYKAAGMSWAATGAAMAKVLSTVRRGGRISGVVSGAEGLSGVEGISGVEGLSDEPASE